MKFKINNMEWIIKELSQEEIKTIQNNRKAKEEENVKSLDTRYFGVTYHDSLEIILDKDLAQDRKKKTLIHELTHCFIGCYITHQERPYDEEMVADIVSNSYDIIHKIVDDYFTPKLVMENPLSSLNYKISTEFNDNLKIGRGIMV